MITTKHLTAGLGAATLVATLVAVAGSAEGSAGATAAASRQHTITETFTSRVVHTVPISKTSSIELAADVVHGKAIGSDSTVARLDPATGIVKGEFSFTRPGGVMSGTFTLDTHDLTLTGTIDHGEGALRGVHGTLSGHAVNRKVTDVTLTYTR